MGNIPPYPLENVIFCWKKQYFLHGNPKKHVPVYLTTLKNMIDNLRFYIKTKKVNETIK